ncbi:MAG: Glyoxalase/bleomycin resistance protein/dioxygenase [Fluviicola sp.]|jgi:catechol 2,3-dioxygenase-like lactoylglutathione lyase family enzyme|uniref:VOC family protein n=1 Tax=Fluviicola sp. TaxID=1917219 RepID=UPI002616FA86|nr:VOC family protein [Fluviicola sp.]MDF3026801.1 Glyoxalase/bleomycin resistance protein/dioxygenase [Fluviicola sp.]
MIRFAYTILYVSDVKRTAEFYSKTFGLEVRFIAPGDEYAELNTGTTTLSFAALSLAKSNLKDGFQESDLKTKPFGIELGFTTVDVQELVDKAIAAGATLLEEPREKPWGQMVAYVRDFDGFLIEICTPMD